MYSRRDGIVKILTGGTHKHSKTLFPDPKSHESAKLLCVFFFSSASSTHESPHVVADRAEPRLAFR